LDFNSFLLRLRKLVLSPRGKNVLVFLAFLVIAAVLWVVMTLNEDVQKDMRCSLVIVNVPDSVTMVSPLPETVNVNVSARASQLLKYDWGASPKITIDYKYFIHGNTIALGDAELRAAMRDVFGSNAQILALNPDSISLKFTSLPPKLLPVIVDSHVATAANAIMVAPPRLLVDSVRLYSVEPVGSSVVNISTMPVNISDLASDRRVRVPLKVPRGMRAIPDSVDVEFKVEKLINTHSNITIDAVNVPAGVNLLLFPNQMEVWYMLPMTQFEANNHGISLVVDYNWIERNSGATSVPVSVVVKSSNARGVHLAQDSVSFMIER